MYDVSTQGVDERMINVHYDDDDDDDDVRSIDNWMLRVEWMAERARDPVRTSVIGRASEREGERARDCGNESATNEEASQRVNLKASQRVNVTASQRVNEKASQRTRTRT